MTRDRLKPALWLLGMTLVYCPPARALEDPPCPPEAECVPLDDPSPTPPCPPDLICTQSLGYWIQASQPSEWRDGHKLGRVEVREWLQDSGFGTWIAEEARRERLTEWTTAIHLGAVDPLPQGPGTEPRTLLLEASLPDRHVPSGGVTVGARSTPGAEGRPDHELGLARSSAAPLPFRLDDVRLAKPVSDPD